MITGLISFSLKTHQDFPVQMKKNCTGATFFQFLTF